MRSPESIRSILAVDFGSVYTRVVLIDAVDGTYRMVARGENRTTDGFPIYNIEIGLMRVLRQLGEMTGRRFFTDDRKVITPEGSDRRGVDLFAITASIGRPLRTVLIGLVPDVSIASALRAANGTYIDVRAVISLDDGRDEEDRLNAILLNYPDLILLAGGTEGGAENAVMRNAELVRLAVELIDRRRRPAIIYTGNSALGPKIEALFEDAAPVFPAQNVRPTLYEERLSPVRLQLGRAYDTYKETRDENFAALSAMSQTGVLPTAQGYPLLASYLSRVEGGKTALLDVGSATTAIAFAEGKSVASAIRTDVGLGHSAPALIESVGVDAVMGWLPLYLSEARLTNYTLNKSLRTASIPMTLLDLYIEHALLRGVVRQTIADAHPQAIEQPPALKRVIASGSALTRTGTPAYDAMLILDCLQPVGVTTLETDPHGLLPAMGALANHLPEAVVQLFESGSLTRLGTSISLDKMPRLDRPAMKIHIEPLDDDAPIVEDVLTGGHIWVYRLGFGQRARVRITCTRGLSIGGKRKIDITLEGGTMGILFDARGRPLPLGDTVKARAAQLPLWIHEATGQPLQEIDPAWLEEPAAEEAAPAREGRRGRRKDKAAKKPGRRGRRRGRRKESEGDILDERLMEAKADSDEDEDELGELRNVLS
ncbi:MAG: glutamate mutase L [Phototrophicaceae bacterium]